MSIQRSLFISGIVVSGLLLLHGPTVVGQHKPTNVRKSACTTAHPESMCSANNTCGSSSSPCMVDVKRTSDSAATRASITDAKDNALFCVKTGTKVTWQSESKNTGFVIDFGASSPFDPPGTVIGGSDRSVTVVAKTPGCFKYSTGACMSGATYGMCDSVDGDVIILGAD
jgi:plastocyanin